MTDIKTVNFHGDTLVTVANDSGVPLIAIRPICDALGLDWSAQLKRIKRHSVLSKAVAMMATPFGGLGQDMACLPLDKLDFWLATIDDGRVKDPETRNRLIQYQEECAKCLYKHFRVDSKDQTKAFIQVEEDHIIFNGRKISPIVWQKTMDHVSLTFRINGQRAAQEVAEMHSFPIGSEYSESAAQLELYQELMGRAA